MKTAEEILMPKFKDGMMLNDAKRLCIEAMEEYHAQFIPTEGTKLYSEEQVKRIRNITSNAVIGQASEKDIEERNYILNHPFLIHKDKGELQSKLKEIQEITGCEDVSDFKEKEAYYESLIETNVKLVIANKELSTPLDKEGYGKEEVGICYRWKKLNSNDPKTYPTKSGFYPVQTNGGGEKVREDYFDGIKFHQMTTQWLEEINLSPPPLQKDKEEMTDEEIEKYIEKNHFFQTRQEECDFIAGMKAYRDRLKNK